MTTTGAVDRLWTGLGLGAGIGLLIGAIVAVVLRSQTSFAVSWWYLLTLGALIGAVVGGAIALALADAAPYRLHEWAPIRTETILRQAVRRYREAGWSVTASADDAVTLQRRGRPNSGITVLLLLLGVIPGVVYWFLLKRTATTVIAGEAVPDGTEVEITVSQSGDGGRVSAVAFFNSLHDLVAEPTNGRSGPG